jgi:hypothetical protein
MSFTRFHDDPARIQKQLQESTYLARYQLDTPGQGVELPFMEDPNIRLQGFGANVFNKNTTQLESELFGITRRYNRDLFEANDYKKYGVTELGEKPYFKSQQPFVEESRATHPAWLFRSADVNRWEEPWLNPLVGLEKPFHENIQTRILEKDYYLTPVITQNAHY